MEGHFGRYDHTLFLPERKNFGKFARLASVFLDLNAWERGGRLRQTLDLRNHSELIFGT
jgi:hypothetical protein